jgi:chromosome segregation ATPase
LQEEQLKVTAARQEMQGRQDVLARTMEQVVEICPNRVKVTKSANTLDREIAQIQAKLSEAERGFGCTREELVAQFNEKTQARDAACVDIERIFNEHKRMKQSLAHRLRMMQKFKMSIARRTRRTFQLYLSSRGYSGTVEFDHKAKTLQPKVQTNDKEAAHSSEKDPRSLSGGEKSFSTLCLLMALWESMGCPIRW